MFVLDKVVHELYALLAEFQLVFLLVPSLVLVDFFFIAELLLHRLLRLFEQITPSGTNFVC
jgi:hypothetical protein